MRHSTLRLSIALLLGAGVIAAGCARHGAAPQPSPSPSPSPTATVRTVANPLDGEPVKAESIRHRISAVMIDNYPHNTRPQSGLRDADLVYEAEAEGGITRYMALFLDRAPSKIGPVRSARLYFVDLARPYNPLFAHAGENDDVWEPLRELKLAGFADMEEILGVSEAFWRDESREMPHNLYTSIGRLRNAAPNHGWPDRPFAGAGFKFIDPVAEPGAPDIVVDFWRHYEVRYAYADGSYHRLIDGIVQHDLDDARPYEVADVVAVWIPAIVLDDKGDLQMDVYGKFPALAMRNGLTTPATWNAPGPDAPPSLVDASGDPILLTPGQIYVEVLPQGGRVKIGNQSWSY